MNFLLPTVEIKFKTIYLKDLNSFCASDSMFFLLDADNFSFYFSRLLLVLEVLHLVINTKADYWFVHQLFMIISYVLSSQRDD